MTKVTLGYVHPEQISSLFVTCLIHEIASGSLYGVEAEMSGPGISHARNVLVDRFMRTDSEYLLMVDTDMVWKPGQVPALVEAAVEHGHPILGALCFGRRDDEIFPTMYVRDQYGQPSRLEMYPPDTEVPVTATGAAFLLVHRDVFDTIQQAGFSVGRPWFAESEMPGGHRLSEDITFCLRAEACGFPVVVHTGIAVGHVKSIFITEQTYWDQRSSGPAPSQPQPVGSSPDA